MSSGFENIAYFLWKNFDFFASAALNRSDIIILLYDFPLQIQSLPTDTFHRHCQKIQSFLRVDRDKQKRLPEYPEKAATPHAEQNDIFS